MKKKLLIGLSVLCAILILVVVGSLTRSQDNRIRIAINIPMTGIMAPFSSTFPISFKEGLETECQKLGMNSNFCKIDLMDNESKTENAVTVFHKHELSGFDVYISGGNPQSKAIMNLVKEYDVPHVLLSFEAGMPKFDKNTVRLIPNLGMEYPLFIEYAKFYGAKKVVSVSLDDPGYEMQYVDLIVPGMKKAGIPLIREKIGWTFSDYRMLAKKIRQENPDLVFISSIAYQIRPLLMALREIDFVKRGNVYVTLDLIDIIHAEGSDDLVDGIAFSCPNFELETCSEAARKWKENWTSNHGTVPTYVAAYGYDIGRLFSRIYNEYGRITTEGISHTQFSGITGLIKLNDERDLVSSLSMGIVGPKKIIRKVNDEK